jgi:hypothetical protein
MCWQAVVIGVQTPKDNQNPKPFVYESCKESFFDSYAESDTCRRPLRSLQSFSFVEVALLF